MARTFRPEQCPHCGMLFATLANHVERCVMRPDNWERTRVALDDGTGTIRKMHEYMEDPRGGVSYKTLFYAFGAWPQIAARFGLAMHERGIRYSGRTHKRTAGLDAAIEAAGAEIDRMIAENRALRFECGAFRM